MFKIFVVAYLVSGGAQVAAGKSDAVYQTREACETVRVAREAKDPLTVLKLRIEQRIHKEVSIQATCEKVDDQGESEERV